jgi:hypothetical protein
LIFLFHPEVSFQDLLLILIDLLSFLIVFCLSRPV